MSPYCNTKLRATNLKQIPPSDYNGLAEGLFAEPSECVARSITTNVTILDAVGLKAIKDFRRSNRYEGLEEVRYAKKLVPIMP